MAYTKLFSNIITSTIWMEPDETRIAWITLLALADKNGEVQGSVPGLARIAGVPVEACRAALLKFLSPDPDSRTKSDEGRRIEEIDGGWSLLNYHKYRRMASKQEQVEMATERVRRYRARKARNAMSTQGNASSTRVHENPTEAEAESEAEADSESRSLLRSESAPRRSRHASGTRLPENWRPNDAGRSFAADRGMDPDSTADAFADYWTANNGRGATKRDWDAAFRTWCRRAVADGKMDAGKNRPVPSSRGNSAFYDQLAVIADRARNSRERGGS